MKTHWYILGAGAIGCLWAKWLAPHATLLLNPTSTLAQELDNAGQIKQLPFNFEYKNQIETLLIPCSLTQTVRDIENLLICTKANQTEAAISFLSLSKNARIVLLQNGMGNQELLKTRFPTAEVFSASTTHGAFRKNKQHIVHAGLGETFLGQISASKDSNAVNAVIASLKNPFEDIQIDQEMEKRLWVKLAINCAINPLTVIYQCQNGGLLETNASSLHLKSLCQELDNILRAKNFLHHDESCYPIIEQVIKDTASNYSSMYQDFLNKRPSEIDFIQGYLCKEARKLLIPTPENLKVLENIKKIEASY